MHENPAYAVTQSQARHEGGGASWSGTDRTEDDRLGAGRSPRGGGDRDAHRRGVCITRNGVVTLVGDDHDTANRRGERSATERGGAVRQRCRRRADLRHESDRDECRLRDRFPDGACARGRVPEQFPNVTFKVSQDQFSNLMTSTPRLLSSDNPPDLIRLPTLISLVKDDLLKNSTGTRRPSAGTSGRRLSSCRIGSAPTAPAVRGPPIAMGLNNSLTGVFYNKKLAQQIGMTEPPKTVADFEALLAKPSRPASCRSWSGTRPRAVADSRSRCSN